ncbi:MAG: hypothetical protein H6912_02215 [Kordiimonadaceae bacterium]|nr:hypothetical protein [Kordiimonadaceae bacterium]
MYHQKVGESLKQLIDEVCELQVCGNFDGILSLLNNMAANHNEIIMALPDFDSEEVLLYSDNNLAVYYISTPPKMLYPPHEHGMIAISALFKGTETHVFYDRNGDRLVERSRVTFKAPAVVNLDINTVHAICTYDNVPNSGIHFYLGDLENQERSMWDVSGENQRQYVHQDYLNSARPLN